MEEGEEAPTGWLEELAKKAEKQLQELSRGLT